MSTKEELTPLVYQEAAQQPDMSEVERLINEFGVSCNSVAKRGHITSLKPLGQQITEHRAARTTLLDYVRGILAERDALIHDNERLMQIAAQEVSVTPRPASAAGDSIVDYLWNNDEVMSLNAELGLTMYQLSRLARAILYTTSATEVPMPEPDRMRTGTDGELYGEYTEYQMIHYGDAREATGYVAGVAAGGKDAERYRWLTEDHDSPATRERCRELLGRMPVMSYSAASAAIDAALRGEAK